MKKTLSINLNNIVFNIDEDAYNKLNDYISRLDSHFKNVEGGNEIVSDIEARISEILSEKLSKHKAVITIEDIDIVIQTLGNPEDIINTDESEEKNSKENFTENNNSKKRKLFRDVDDRIIGGVCSGIAAYFDIDTVLVRLIMIVSIFAFSPLIYLVLWIVVPAALTTAQKLEMKGEKVNISNIEKTIKKEFEDVKENFKNFKKSKSYKNSRSFFLRFIDVIFQIIGGIFKAIGGIIGFAFILVGTLILVVFLGSIFFENFAFEGINLMSFINLFTDYNNVTMFSIGLILIVCIPLIAIIYSGFKLMFRFKSNNKVIGFIAFISWVIALSFILYSSYTIYKEFNAKEIVSETIEINDNKADTLYINSLSCNYSEYDRIIKIKNNELINIDDSLIIRLKPIISINKSDIEKPSIEIKKISYGKSSIKATDFAKELYLDYKIDSNKIFINDCILIDKSKKWRNQEVRVIINIPADKNFVVDKEILQLVD